MIHYEFLESPLCAHHSATSLPASLGARSRGVAVTCLQGAPPSPVHTRLLSGPASSENTELPGPVAAMCTRELGLSFSLGPERGRKVGPCARHGKLTPRRCVAARSQAVSSEPAQPGQRPPGWLHFARSGHLGLHLFFLAWCLHGISRPHSQGAWKRHLSTGSNCSCDPFT